MEHLREIRLSKKMTQDELSKKSGISRTTISKLENGKQTTVTNTTIIALADALGIPAGLLV